VSSPNKQHASPVLSNHYSIQTKARGAVAQSHHQKERDLQKEDKCQKNEKRQKGKA
jgi:hypothetical protein